MYSLGLQAAAGVLPLRLWSALFFSGCFGHSFLGLVRLGAL